MSPSQTSFVAIYVEAPDRVEHLGSHTSLRAAKEQANAHFSGRHKNTLHWHDEAWGGSRARHLHTEYLIRELEWERSVTAPPDLSNARFLMHVE
jgi:hypothetical protein